MCVSLCVCVGGGGGDLSGILGCIGRRGGGGG